MTASDWPTVRIGALGKVSGSQWPYVEQVRGQFDWTHLDAWVNEASAHGISLLYSSGGVPPWAAADKSTCHPLGYFGAGSICTGTVSNLQDWDDFVTALVTRYKGKISIYELWNEPQTSFTGTFAELVALTQHEHDIIRTLDPTATILSPSLVSWGYQYMDDYFAAGGTQYVDAVAIHTYPNPNNDIPETLISITKNMRTVMSKYGLTDKPLWDTEGSWGNARAGAITDPNLRDAFLARYYLFHWSIGVSRVYWYAWDSPNWGTLYPPGSTPAVVAYQQVYNWMLGAVMTQPCSLNGSTLSYHAVYTCDLTRSGGYAARAVWNTDGESTYVAPSEYLHYRDLSGKVYSVPGDHQVTIGLKPILLENF